TGLLLGGERVDRELIDRIRAVFPQTRLWNVYGPTETTANACAALLDTRQRAVPIGAPIWNDSCYVLDDRLEPVPVSVAGELCTGGEGGARGSGGGGGLPAERSLPDPFSGRAGARMSRTGDLARWLPSGQVEFVGRRDHQVKIRGLRIEPAEA